MKFFRTIHFSLERMGRVAISFGLGICVLLFTAAAQAPHAPAPPVQIPISIQILDAMGNPIPFAAVDVILDTPPLPLPIDVPVPLQPTPRHRSFGSIELFRNYQYRPLQVGKDGVARGLIPVDSTKLEFKIFHPQYGIVYGTSKIISGSLGSIRTPLVRAGSDDVLHAIRGVVVDPLGKPLPNSILTIRHEGAGWDAFFGNRFEMVTDAQGRFCYHLAQVKDAASELAREQPSFAITIRPPDESELGILWAVATNDKETRLTMEAGVGPLTFDFRDESNKPIDQSAEKFEVTFIYTDSQGVKNNILVEDSQRVLDGSIRVPAGYLSAIVKPDGDLEREIFAEVIPVTMQTRTVVLKPATLKPVTGIVLDGLTQKPVADAWVSVDSSIGKLQYRVSEESTLETLLAVKPPLNPADFVKTDAQGRVELPPSVHRSAVDQLVIFKKGYVTAEAFDENCVEVIEGKITSPGKIDVGSIELWPSAVVEVEVPVVHAPQLVDHLDFKWQHEGSFDSLHPSGKFGSGPNDLENINTAQLDGPKSRILVPANTPIEISVDLSYSGTEKCVEVNFKEPITLGLGEVKKFGPIKVRDKIPVSVRVLDEHDHPVSGLEVALVREVNQSCTWQEVAKPTDNQGNVTLYVMPDTTLWAAAQGVGQEEAKTPKVHVDNAAPEPLILHLTADQIKESRKARPFNPYAKISF